MFDHKKSFLVIFSSLFVLLFLLFIIFFISIKSSTYQTRKYIPSFNDYSISTFSSPDKSLFECTGSCHCIPPNSERRTSSTAKYLITRGLQYATVSLTTFLALQSAKLHFLDECEKLVLQQTKNQICPPNSEIVAEDLMCSESEDIDESDWDTFARDHVEYEKLCEYKANSLKNQNYNVEPVGMVMYSLDPDQNEDLAELRNEFMKIGLDLEHIKKPVSFIKIFDSYRLSMKGLESGDLIAVFYILDRVEEQKVDYEVETEEGTFGTFKIGSWPDRKNRIGFSITRIVAMDKEVIVVERFDAYDFTPVIDIKKDMSYDPSFKIFWGERINEGDQKK